MWWYLLGMTRPVVGAWRRARGSVWLPGPTGPDHSGATAPDSHRLPRSTRVVRRGSYATGQADRPQRCPSPTRWRGMTFARALPLVVAAVAVAPGGAAGDAPWRAP